MVIQKGDHGCVNRWWQWRWREEVCPGYFFGTSLEVRERMESGCLLALGYWMKGMGSPGIGVPSFPDDGGTKIGPASLDPVGYK